MLKSEVVVYATPLYVFTVSGLMKDLMDRLIPMAQPYVIKRGNHYIHPPRYPPVSDGPSKVVLISNSGYPERHHFSGLEETYRRFTDSPDEELAGVICCAGGALLESPALRESATWYLDAAREAGRQVISTGHIAPETQAILDRPVIESPEAYVNILNGYWQSQGVELYDPSEGPKAEPALAHDAVPLAPPQGMDTMRDLVAGMAMGFNADAAGDLSTAIQFEVTDAQDEAYYLDIGGGACRAYAGRHAAPSLTILTPAEVWMAISRGEMSGAAAMMQGKYSVKGDIGLLMRLGKLFGRP
jgi:putative sterol carrier protein